MTNVLTVRTIEQKAIFENELQGQISDGNWENEDTDSRLWNCEVEVAEQGEKLGPNWAVNYPLNFNEDFLIDVVGDRMVNYAKVFNPAYTEDNLRADLKELTKIVFEQPPTAG